VSNSKKPRTYIALRPEGPLPTTTYVQCRGILLDTFSESFFFFFACCDVLKNSFFYFVFFKRFFCFLLNVFHVVVVACPCWKERLS